MKIYCAHSSLFDFKTEFYAVLDSGFKETLHVFTFPHLSPDVHFSSKDSIKVSDFVLAEVSYPATGLGIELGWADAFGVPILAVYQKGKSPSKSINFLTSNVVGYTSSEHLLEIVKRFIDR